MTDTKQALQGLRYLSAILGPDKQEDGTFDSEQYARITEALVAIRTALTSAPDTLAELLGNVPDGYVCKFWPPSKISDTWDCVIKKACEGMADEKPSLGMGATPAEAIQNALTKPGEA